jgi:hypothetical protein
VEVEVVTFPCPEIISRKVVEAAWGTITTVLFEKPAPVEVEVVYHVLEMEPGKLWHWPWCLWQYFQSFGR